MAMWPYLMMDQPLNNCVCGYFPELHVGAIILLDLNTVAISENNKHRDNTILPSSTTYLLYVYHFH